MDKKKVRKAAADSQIKFEIFILPVCESAALFFYWFKQYNSEKLILQRETRNQKL
jgi:hypothetical protein